MMGHMMRHVFFDLDNTLMLSRTEMAPEHRPLFIRLCSTHDVIVVSGAQESQIKTQIPDDMSAHFYVLAQTGNHALDKNGKELWKEQFTEEQTRMTLAFIEKIKRDLNLTVRDSNDLIELRGAQISYSPIGHHEALEKKYAFDPKTQLRRRVLNEHKKDVEELHNVGVDVVPGGTTCFDFFLAGKTKGFNIERLIALESWQKDECIYVGDALFKGGNDETVIGVIPTKSVANPTETFQFVESLLI
jgi:phosphomannomutase